MLSSPAAKLWGGGPPNGGGGGVSCTALNLNGSASTKVTSALRRSPLHRFAVPLPHAFSTGEEKRSPRPLAGPGARARLRLSIQALAAVDRTSGPAWRDAMTLRSNARIVRAPRGPEMSCRTWGAEAALRMLMNNLDPDVAERPEDLVVYGGIGKAARDWACFDRIVGALTRAGAGGDAAGPVGQAGRRLPHPRGRAARADRQFEPGAANGRPGSTSTSSIARG